MSLTQDKPQTTLDRARPRGRGRLVALLAGAVALLLVGLLLGTLLGRDGATPPEEGQAQDAAGQEDAAVPEDVPEADGSTLSWAPPELEDPERVEITEDNRSLELEDDQDYELVMPDEPMEAPGGVVVIGGRNVVLIGGEISVPDTGETEGGAIRGLFLKDQTGTVHVEGVAFTGEGLKEGINLDQREGAIVQLQNLRLGTVSGTEEGHHADVIQVWAGPAELRVDGLTGSTNYQGFFLLPNQFGEQPEPELFDLRRIDLTGEDGTGYLLWRDEADWPVKTSDVWVSPPGGEDDRETFLWPREEASDGSWEDVQVGTPPGGSFVPEGVAGVGYESPGYGGNG